MGNPISFVCCGFVRADEYDWKAGMLQTKKLVEDDGDIMLVFDAGKVLGVAQHALDLEAELARLKELVFGDGVREKVAKDCHDKYHDDRWCATCNARADGIDDFQQAIKERVRKPAPVAGLDLAREGETSKSVEVVVETEKPLPKPDHQKTQKYIDDLMQAHKDTANSKLKFGEKP